VSERESRQVDYGSADDGHLGEEAPDLGPLREAADAAELAEAMSGLSDGPVGRCPPLIPSARLPVRSPGR
jgi:hypothetical protein